ncbi:MAG: ribosome recycling factor [Bacteroidota bacterium]
MQEEIDFAIDAASESMDNAMKHLQRELSKVRTGKASPSIFDGLMVEYYGSDTPLNQVANVGLLDARTLTIQPWEKSMLEPIEKAIFAANLGLTPQNDGNIIRITIPMLTEERRRDLVKQVKQLGEDTKVTIRKARREANDEIKDAVKNGYSEDMGKRMEEKVQKMTDGFIAKVDEFAKKKEEDVMTV